MKVYTFTEKELDEVLRELHDALPISVSVGRTETIKDALVVATMKNNQVTER